MTPDSAFGYQRRGTPASVAELGTELGYQVVVVPQFQVGPGEVVSSGAIRTAIAQGDVLNANRLLGRAYAVIGTSIRTPSRGRCELVTRLPVALPPPGTYPVRIGPPSGTRSHLAIEEAVIDAAGRLSVPCHRGRMQRVVFDVDPRTA
jgi:riboflavin kinase/FMN adenylyltransferase